MSRLVRSVVKFIRTAALRGNSQPVGRAKIACDITPVALPQALLSVERTRHKSAANVSGVATTAGVGKAAVLKKSVVLSLLCVVILSLPVALRAQEQDEEKPFKTIDIKSITIVGHRPLSAIGTQKTVIDTLVLHENVVSSIADILSSSSSIFIKSYGRSTLATASFRGTAASHTQVTWNGMKLNSPMLGMVDFSLIPSYFIDDASLYHGASSVGVTGGGLGGAVALSTNPVREEGFGLKYVQGIGSFSTYDEYLRLTYGRGRLRLSTRVMYTSSKNDFKYTNYKKKQYIKDDDGNIIGRYYPVERNKNGWYKDLHIMQEVFYDTAAGDQFSFSAWYLDSDRGMPLLSVDRKQSNKSKEYQIEKTFRSTLKWSRVMDKLRLEARAGYLYTDFQYLKEGDTGAGLQLMRHSKNFLHTVYGQFDASLFVTKKWLFTANASLHQHFAKNSDKASRDITADDYHKHIDQARPEVSAMISAKYKPVEQFGVAVNARVEWYGTGKPQLIPAAFAEYTIIPDGSLLLKASVARNYRFPTLNDLYFIPGGNPDLRPERGFTYDGGLEYILEKGRFNGGAEVSLFDSYIKDWILWVLEPPIPTPINIKEVRSYGAEFKAKLGVALGRDWRVDFNGNFSIANSINRREPFSEGDNSIGKQLPYIPKYSSAVTGTLTWKMWKLTYKWQYYSERFTTSANDYTDQLGVIGKYYMNDVALQYMFAAKWGVMSFKFNVNNLFDEEYESVMARPMPGRNYGLYIEFTPKFRKK